MKPTHSLPLRFKRVGGVAIGITTVVALLAMAGCSYSRLQVAKELVARSDPFQAQPAAPVASLLVIGDSTAVGTGASSPAHSVPGMIGASHPYLRTVNRAVNGARYVDFEQQLQQSPEHFDVVLVLGGGNDVMRLTGEDALLTSIRNVAALATARGNKVILMPPGNVGNAPFFYPPVTWLMTRRSQVLHALIRQAAQDAGVVYVNLYKPRSEDPFAQRPEETHAGDGLHPSDEGYRLWLEDLQKQAGLDALLKK